MRVWDISPRRLCRQHLLGEHRELHAVWAVVTEGKKGYSNHPETKRWVGKTRALYQRHELLVAEMERRGYNHQSPLDKRKARGPLVQTVLIDSVSTQRRLLKARDCDCPV